MATSWAQQHGGPWPATSNPSHSSVGAAALVRFTRPVAYRDIPERALPPALRVANPWSLPRSEGPLSCLNEARCGIVWGAMGAARSSFEATVWYSQEHVQFGKPIAGFQLTQKKLADIYLEFSKGMLLAIHLGRTKDAGTLRLEQVSLGKLNNVREALEICRTARTILGANGIPLSTQASATPTTSSPS